MSADDSPPPPRAEVDHTLCAGVGECIRTAPHAFRYNKERLAIFKGTGQGYTVEDLQEAVDCCPMQAIRLIERATGSEGHAPGD